MKNTERIQELMYKIGYEFKNKNLLVQALTHSSYANEHNNTHKQDNEKLEFLGDSVLDLICTEYIINKFVDLDEGKLSKIKSQIISEIAFSSISNELNLGEYLFLSNGETYSGGRKRKSILADAFEALIGAIYLDGGFSSAKEVVVNSIVKRILDNPDTMQLFYDSKTIFQEEIQTFTKEPISYNLISTKGPDHKKIFKVELRVGDELYAIAEGGNKKAAEKKAAFLALKKLERI